MQRSLQIEKSGGISHAIHLHIVFCCRRICKLPAFHLSDYNFATENYLLETIQVLEKSLLYMNYKYSSAIHYLQLKCRCNLQVNVTWVIISTNWRKNVRPKSFYTGTDVVSALKNCQLVGIGSILCYQIWFRYYVADCRMPWSADV